MFTAISVVNRGVTSRRAGGVVVARRHAAGPGIAGSMDRSG
jgi:hypothetical protein